MIPKGTRSAKLARKGITDEEEMGNFLTAVFADTLNGKIKLPTPTSGIGVPSRLLNGVEQKLRRGLPIGIQATGSLQEASQVKDQRILADELQKAAGAVESGFPLLLSGGKPTSRLLCGLWRNVFIP